MPDIKSVIKSNRSYALNWLIWSFNLLLSALCGCNATYVKFEEISLKSFPGYVFGLLKLSPVLSIKFGTNISKSVEMTLCPSSSRVITS